MNQQLKEASSYLNNTNAQLQKALIDQSAGGNLSNSITNIMNNLTIQLTSAQEGVNTANEILASDQAQLATSQGNLGSTQGAITSAQTAYNRSLDNVESAKQRIANC